MDPITRVYMESQWNEDKVEQYHMLEEHAKFLGWFFNPEMAKKLSNQHKYAVDDEEFDKASEHLHEIVKQQINESNKGLNKRARRRRKKVLSG